MWQHLTLSSLGVIESAELELGPGLTVITGETGAGKTMVVTALGLLRGDRADLGLVRSGADRARVEAEIAVPASSAVAGTVSDAGGRIDDDVVVLGRTLSAQGRSRAFAGGASVPAGLLADVTDELVAVHGQSDQHRLVRAGAQRQALDAFAGEPFAAVMAEYEPAFTRWRAVERRLEQLRTHAQERARELDLLRHGLEEISGVEPGENEDDDLKVEIGRLAHAELLAGSALSAHAAIAADDVDGAAARSLVTAAESAVANAAGHDPELDALAARVREIGILLDETATDLRSYATAVELDPVRLGVAQDRLAALTGLQRKYGPTTADVLAWRDKAAVRLTELDADDDTIEALEAERQELEPRVRRLAARLGEVRGSAGERLAGLVDAELAQLSMPFGRLSVQVSSTPDGVLAAHGADDVELLFSANSGSAPRPLSKGASGGELSRLMLALEVVLADRSSVPTLVFDEVDAGIGGKAAVEVGRRLARLSEHAQVLVVTHLPQVAAFADHHFRVTKDDQGVVTSSSVVDLDSDQRVDELARMLAGQEESATAQAHARELLELARAR